MNARDGDYAVEEIAHAWFVKMRGEEAKAIRPEFEAWLAAAPAHRDAYEQISRAMAASAILKTSPRFGSETARQKRAGSARRWLPWGAAATGALLVATVVGMGTMFPAGPTLAPSAYASEPLITQRGEIRTFRLPDGSTATLDTESRLELRYSAGERRVRLSRGRVRLMITRADRPFIVEAGAGTAQTEAAVIDLMVDEAQTDVALVAGETAELRISAPSPDAGKPQTLGAGEQMSFRTDGRSTEALRAPIARAQSDWPSGWAEYGRISVGSLVDEANRYAIDPIIIDDRTVSELSVSGRFNLKNTDAFARRVADLFGLAIREQPDGLHLGSR